LPDGVTVAQKVLVLLASVRIVLRQTKHYPVVQ
jgi:hypothetical protein